MEVDLNRSRDKGRGRDGPWVSRCQQTAPGSGIRSWEKAGDSGSNGEVSGGWERGQWGSIDQSVEGKADQ